MIHDAGLDIREESRSLHRRRYAVQAFAGFSEAWSRAHAPVEPDGYDGAIAGYVEELQALGFATLSSCQGGWLPAECTAHWRAVDAITVDDVRWTPTAPHLYIEVGPGHGGDGVVQRLQAIRARGINTDLAELVATRFSTFHPRIVADESATYVVLESHRALHDTEAETWWRNLMTRARAT